MRSAKPLIWTAIVIVLLLGVTQLVIWPLELVVYLLAGWALFLRRVGAELRVDWPTVLFSLACMAAFSLGLHRFLAWLAVARSSDDSIEAEPHGAPRFIWRWQWTASIVGLIMIMFVAGLCVTGIVHQAAWWARDERPTFQSSSEVFMRVESRNNSRQIALVTIDYMEKHDSLPPGGTMTADGEMLHGWLTMLLPYVEEQQLFAQIDLNRPWNDDANRKAMQTDVSTYQSRWTLRRPSERETPEGYWTTDYAANVRVIGGVEPLARSEITDGAGQTIVSGEAFTQRKPWGHPANWRDPADGVNQSPSGFNSPWTGGAHFSFADGSVRFIQEDVDPNVLRALATPDGGESIDAEPRQ